MKFVKALLVLLLSLPIVVSAKNYIQAPTGFVGDAFKATMILRARRNHAAASCTATAYEKIDGGYHLLSAGHCIEKGPGWVYTVADDITGPETPVTVVKSTFDEKFDFAVLEMKTAKSYPVIPLGTTVGVTIGDNVINVNFAAAAAKQLSFGTVASGTMDKDWEGEPGNFLVHINGAGGSSGSAVISASSHTIIGVVELEYTDERGLYLNIGMGIESIDNFQDFMNAPVQPETPADDFLKFIGR